MGFFLNLNTSITKCINGCKLFSDTNDFSYWETKEATNDEKYIVEYLNSNNLIVGKNVLHMGVGNSFLANNISNYNKIDGITLSKKEMDYGLQLNIFNYNIFLQNKYSSKNLLNTLLKSYDLIIDVNLKSFACCDDAFKDLFSRYTSMLRPGGIIITGREGMKWSRQLKPVLSFSMKNFFYKRLKEFDGPRKNILSEDDCIDISKDFSLYINTDNNNLVIFKKTI